MRFKRASLWVTAAFMAVTFIGAPAHSDVARTSDPRLINQSFETALQKIEAGKPQAAVLSLRAILARNPNLLRVRLELARALFLTGDMESARQEFLTVLSADSLPAPVTQNILRFIRAIDAYEGFTYSYLFSLTTPTGAGRSYDTDVVYLDLFNTGLPLPFTLTRKKAPRYAVKFEGSVKRLWRMKHFSGSGALAFYLRGHVRIIDAPGSAFDDDRLDFAPGLQFTWPLTTLQFETRTSIFYTGGVYSENRVGLGATLQRRNVNGLSFSADIALSHARNRISDLITGRLFESNFRLQQGTGGNGFRAVELTFENREANRSDNSYSHAVLRLSRQINFKGGFSANASVYGDYYVQSSPTPGFATRRKGREYGMDVMITKTDSPLLNRYAPFVSIGASRHNSSIKAFSFNELRIQIGVQSVF